MSNTTSTELDKILRDFERIAIFNANDKYIGDFQIGLAQVRNRAEVTQAIEAYVAQRINKTLADCYADGLINARTRAAFRSVNNKMGGEDA